MECQMSNLEKNGFEILQNFVSQDSMNEIKHEVEAYDALDSKYGIRSADKRFSTIDKLAQSSLLIDKAIEILGSQPQVVRVIYFDKTKDNNWLVPWHQDRTIALNKKVDVNGWGRWSVKDGVPHVQPSIDVLERMVTFRVHLDDSDQDNGCLKVIPYTHRLGLLEQQEIQKITAQNSFVNCEVKAGDVVLMRPHILHASSKCEVAYHRRIVHIEYSNYRLPQGLEWA